MKTSKLNLAATVFAIGAISLVVTGIQVKKGKAVSDRPASKNGTPKLAAFKLVLVAEKEKVSKGGPINITVSIQNTGQVPLGFTEGGFLRDYKVIVKNLKGEDVPLTKEAEEIMKSGVVSLSSYELTPGTKLNGRDGTSIDKLYQISAGRTYYITLKRKAYRMDNRTPIEATSNTVKVTVGS